MDAVTGPARNRQLASAGDSSAEIHDAALRAAEPIPGLTWLDIGCGRGDLLRKVRDAYAPASLSGTDVIRWLDADIDESVAFLEGPAEQTLPVLKPHDRVLLVETIEHLDAPWTVLQRAAQLVRPGGRLVVTTPHVATLRHRLDLAVRGQLTAFRPDNEPHMTPALPHVITRVMADEGLEASVGFAGRDVIPFTKGRLWPAAYNGRFARLGRVSVVAVGSRAAA